MPDGLSARHAADHGAILTLPNIITLARLCAVPVTVWLVLRRDLQPAFWMFLAAGLSDALDGWLARRGAGSALGTMLDPLADKVLLTSMYIVMAVVGLLPDWLAILVVFRDLVIVGGVVLIAVLGRVVRIAPLPVSKVNTVAQIVLVGSVLLLSGFAWPYPRALDWLVWCVAATTFISGAAYVRGAAVQG